MMKKTLSLILALVMILGSFSAVFAEGEATPAAPAEATAAPAEATEAPAPAVPVVENAKVKWLQESGLVKGYADGSLGLDKTITRAEFAAILVRGMGLEAEALKAMAIPSKFVDMGGHWANGYVEVAVGNGLVKGYPNMTFRPNAQITYAEVVAMLTRATKSISAMEEISAVWPNTYIVKAAQAGILENTLIGNYNEAAVREKAFELIYNAMNNANLKGFGNNSVVKAIVLENNRVESLGNKEIVVEYIKVLQESDYVNAVRKSGDLLGKQERFMLDEKVGDVEELLGKVVDFTIDRDGKLVKATVDKSYEYLMGGITAEDRFLTVNGRKYTVEQREQYNKTEDRLYRTYLNGDDFKYEDFYRMNRKDSFSTNFARVTIKNGKVVFIDAYEFTDIAPVKEVKNSANDVYFYNDQRDGKVDRYTPGRYVITYTEKYGFKRDVKDSIKTDDVIHIFKNGVIVKQDAKVEDKLTKTYVDKYGENVVLGSGDTMVEAWLNDKPFASVYSYEGKEYRTLPGRAALEAIRGRTVKALIAIDGSLQLVDSDLKLEGGVAGIDSILSRGEVRFLPAKGDKYTGAETYDTWYYVLDGSLNRRLLSAFDVNDLVYTSIKKNDKTNVDELEVMFMLKPQNDMAGTEGYRNLFKPARVDSRYINLYNAYTDAQPFNHYRYMDNINVFGWNDVDGLYQVDLAKVIRDNKDNADLKAFVMSDFEVRELLEKTYKWKNLYNFISNDPRMANTVVFTGLKGSKADAVYRYAEVIRKDNVTNVIEVRYANNRDYKNAKDEIVRTQELAIARPVVADVANVSIGDIVALTISKESLKEEDGKMPLVIGINPVVTRATKVQKIESVNYGTSIKFVDEAKTYFTRFADEFGDSRFAYAQKYIHEKDMHKEYISVIRYLSSGPSISTTKRITYINKVQKTITLDNVDAYILDEFVELIKDNKKYLGSQAIEQLMVGDQVDPKSIVLDKRTGKILKFEVTSGMTLGNNVKALLMKIPGFQNEFQQLDTAMPATTKAAWKQFLDKLNAALVEFDNLTAEEKTHPEVVNNRAALEKLIADTKAKHDALQTPAEEAAAWDKKVTDLLGTNKTKEQLKALGLQKVKELKAKADELKDAEYNKLSPAAKPLVSKMQDLDDYIAAATQAIAELEAPQPQVTATAVADMTHASVPLTGTVPTTITLTGAKAKDVDKATIVVKKADGSVYNAGFNASMFTGEKGERDFFGTVIEKEQVEDNMTIEFTVKGQNLKITITVKRP